MKAWIYMAAHRLRNETLAQDLVEYALMAAFVAVAGGATFPTTIMPAVSTIFSKLDNYFTQANNYGS